MADLGKDSPRKRLGADERLHIPSPDNSSHAQSSPYHSPKVNISNMSLLVPDAGDNPSNRSFNGPSIKSFNNSIRSLVSPRGSAGGASTVQSQRGLTGVSNPVNELFPSRSSLMHAGANPPQRQSGGKTSAEDKKQVTITGVCLNWPRCY
eukprot:gene18748-104_t